jgi:cadmium resistance protein CadD (predicted permease)
MFEAIANIGTWERIIRIVVGLALLVLLLTNKNPWRWIGLLGVIPLLTGLVGWCPFYSWITRD